MPPDQDRLTMLQAAVAGGALYGVWLLAAVVAAGQTPTRADWTRAAINIVCACIAGGLMAYFVGPQLAGLLPWAALRDPLALGFIIGAAGWELIPLIQKWLKKAAAKLMGVDQ